MSSTWVDAPRRPPYRCHATSQDTEDAGPYFEGFTFCAEPGDDREQTFYASRSWFQAALEAPGSPFAAVTKNDLAELVDDRDTLLLRIEQLESDLADASAEAAELRQSRAGPSAEAIAAAVVVQLEPRLPKRP